MYPGPGSGQYVHSAVPGAMSGGPQPNQMGHNPMAMQPGHQGVAQQRMMMQPGQMQGYGPMGGRPMYAQGGMMGHPQHMMQGQGNMVGMYQQPPHHQGPINQGRDYMKEFPHEWRNQIMSEGNPERRHNLYLSYVKRFGDIEMKQKLERSKNGMNAYQMGPSNAMRQGNSPGNVHMVPGHQMNANMNPAYGQNPMQMSNPMVNRQMPPSQPIPAPSSVPSQALPGRSPHNPALAFASQQPVAGSPAAAMSVSAVSVPSPQSNSALPATPQGSNRMLDVPQATPPSNEPCPEFEALREQMKELYYERLKTVGERCHLDNNPQPRGYIQMIEIFENRRVVKLELLKSVKNNLEGMLDRYSLGYPLTCELTGTSESSSPVNLTNVNLPDPWKHLRSKFLRVPPEIVSLYKSEDKNVKAEKRSVKEESDDGPASKKIKSEYPDAAQVVPNSAGLTGNRRFFRKVTSSDEEESPENCPRIELDCQFDTSRKWIMSAAASAELQSLPWSIDKDYLPASHRVPDVRINFEATKILFPPLVVVVPKSYPLDPPIVKVDKSFPPTAPLSAQMHALFERSLSLASGRSLTCIYDAFTSAAEELVRLKGVHKGHFIPSKQQQKQLVA